MKRLLQYIGIAIVLAIVGAAVYAFHLHRRALPRIEGSVTVAGLAGSVEIVRDRWGVPHIFAGREEDGFFGLGWVTAQDRLFQMALVRQLTHGRIAEWIGEPGLELDRLFRTMDLIGVGKRLYAQASLEARRAAEAYARGVNAYVETLDGDLPIEFTILGTDFRPLAPDDMMGVLGFMTWNLHYSWEFDPLYERLVARVGQERAAQLFPYNAGGSPAVYPGTASLQPSLFQLSQGGQHLLQTLASSGASNNWVVAPAKSATGHAILANDPHLGHGQPPVWYQVHVNAGELDVIGVTIPGLPFVVIGHNRHIAWGFTNFMVDSADFFVEKVNPDHPEQVMYLGNWVGIDSRTETLEVKGGDPVELVIRTTPHGPIVSDFFPQREEVLAYQWSYRFSGQGHDVDGFHKLNRARNLDDFRSAVGLFAAVAQNVVYADVEGHIGIQATGFVPRLLGATEGTRFRVGWDGSQEWDGFVPFAELPSVYDPPQGWLASANNPTFAPGRGYYISSHWEPMDRILRIRERLSTGDRFTVEELAAIQSDTKLTSAVEEVPMILAAFDGQPRPEGNMARAVHLLRRWDGDMTADGAAPAVFAAFYKHLFHEIFADEMGADLAQAYREKINLSAIMIRMVMNGAHPHWFDRVDTPESETKAEIIRDALAAAVMELELRLGEDPTDWQWGRLHTLEFVHPLGRLAVFAPYFNVGPFPVPGHANTVNKMQFKDDDWKVYHGPSMRQIADLGNLARSLAVLPTGQSGIPASPHYDDLTPLWLNGEYHPLLMDRDAIDAVAEGTLVLNPTP